MDNANENPMKKLNNKTLSIYGYGQVPMAGSFIYYKSTKNGKMVIKITLSIDKWKRIQILRYELESKIFAKNIVNINVRVFNQ